MICNESRSLSGVKVFGVGDATMKRGMKHGAIWLSLVSVIACIGISYKAGCILFIPKKITFSFDERLSADQKKIIESAFDGVSSYRFSRLASCVKEACPAVASCTFTRLPTQTLHVAVTSENPFLALNQAWILTQDKKIIPRRFFDLDAIQECPMIEVKNGVNPVELSSHFKDWIMSLDPSFFSTYQISWFDDYHIVLNHKKMSTVSLLCSVDVSFNDLMINTCALVLKQCEKRSGADKRKWIADVRFDKQVIVAAQGGRGYG
jgi:hypothetical protein